MTTTTRVLKEVKGGKKRYVRGVSLAVDTRVRQSAGGRRRSRIGHVLVSINETKKSSFPPPQNLNNKESRSRIPSAVRC